jgi:glucan-binding YG repeat protein
MTKKGIVVALAMMAALLPTMPTVVTASEMSETEVQEVTDELRKDSTDKVYNHFTYRIDTEKKYGLSFGNVITITGMDNVNDSTDIELVIPTEIEGYKVTKIDTDAFSGCANIKSVVLNDGLVEIGDNAFQGTSISELDIPATVTRIGMYAFAGTPVTSLVIEEGSAGIQLGVYAFRYCKNLRELELNRVTSIGASCFEGNTSIMEIELPQGLETIGVSAFYGDYNLGGDLVIPSTATDIGSSAFFETAIRSVTIDDGDDYIQIGADAFMKCASLKYANLSNRVIEIYDGAFRYDPVLTWVRIGDGSPYLYIWGFAFCDNRNLRAISMPTKVLEIYHSAFGNCPSLKDVYYASSQEDYNTYVKVGQGNNDAYFNATLHYNSLGPDEWPDADYTGWITIQGRDFEKKDYWYENAVLQGYDPKNPDYRGKEIYDPDSDAWYWLDNIQQGAKAVSKDVYQESEAGQWAENADGTGKWVRYDADGHMVKGWQTTDQGTCYFDPVYGTMAKGTATIDGMTYYFDTNTGILQSTSPVENGWWSDGGQAYWYENGVRQGYDPNNADYRGKEIYDPDSDAWYWLDNVQQGAKAVSKDVYQESEAGQWADRGDGTGKWVRYDANGHMVKGWQTTDQGTYYFDLVYGTMAKGNAEIDGTTYYFDVNTGILQ